MNKIVINVKDVMLPSWGERASNFALKVLDEIGRDGWEVSLLICGDNAIRELNKQYRGKDEATDVLSFNLGQTMQAGEREVYLPGDIVISTDSLRQNAKDFNISEDEELRRLLIHGILHLDGMNHDTIDKNEPMLILQEEILNKLKNETIIFSNSNGGEK